MSQMRLFIFLTCSATFSTISARQGDCYQEPHNCQDDALKSIRLNEMVHLNVTMQSNLEIVGGRRSFNSGSNTVTLQKLSKCRFKVTLHADKEKQVSAVFSVSKRSILKSCSVNGEYSRKDWVVMSNVLSSLFEYPISPTEETTRVERDEFGICLTKYSKIEKSGETVMTTKTRNLNECFATRTTRHKKQSDNEVTQKEWGCVQHFVGDIMTHVKCHQRVEIPGKIEFSEEMLVQFMKSVPAATIEESSLQPVYRGKEIHTGFAETKSNLEEICQSNSANPSDYLHLFPAMIASLSITSSDNIVHLYSDLSHGVVCPDNPVVLDIMTEVLGATYSDEGTEAKCRILNSIKSFKPESWASSLGKAHHPSERTLFACSKILHKPFWDVVVLGIAKLAKNARQDICPLSQKQKICRHSRGFRKISRKLWTAARNCNSASKNYIQTTLLALRGLQILESDEMDVTSTLITCATTAQYPEIGVSTIKAMGHTKCSSKVVEWLQMAIFNASLGSEMRIEAFKSLLLCDKREALNIAERSSYGQRHIDDIQLNSYISSYNQGRNSSSHGLRLSRAFELDVAATLGLESKFILRGDFIMDKSFIPKSMTIQIETDLIKYIRNDVKISLRQNNLERFLRPYLGPHGRFENIQAFVYQTLQEAFGLMDVNKMNDTKSDGTPIFKEERSNIPLEGWITIHHDGHEMSFHPFNWQFSLSDMQTAIPSFISEFLTSTALKILSHQLQKSYLIGLVNHQKQLTTFSGHQLQLHRYEGITGYIDSSSVTDIFASTLSILTKASVGHYDYSSLHLSRNNEYEYARTVTSRKLSFGLDMKLKRKDSENYDIEIDMPSASSNAWETSCHNDLLSSKQNIKVPKCYDCTSKAVCSDQLVQSLGYRFCRETTKEETKVGIVTKKSVTVLKKDPNQNYLKLGISTKNPGATSQFISVLIEKTGKGIRGEASLVIGVTYHPHLTLKILGQGPDQRGSFEASLVDEHNMKRFESRMIINKDEYGVKAEVMMVADGGMLSAKPRFVLSYPGSQEDSLLVGYMSLYRSEKLKSFTLDFSTDGTLKQAVDVTIRGNTELRTPLKGNWSYRIKNFRLISDEINLGVESTLEKTTKGLMLSSQLDWDDEILIFGFDLNNKKPETYDTAVHLFNPNKPNWNTQLNLTSFINNMQVESSLTLEKGADSSAWKLQVIQSSIMHILQLHVEDDISRNSWFGGKAYKFVNTVSVTIPMDNVALDLDHTLFINSQTIENKAVVTKNGMEYLIQSNIFDQSEDYLKYHLEMEVSSPYWKFVYVDTILQQRNGDYVGQAITQLPSGTKISSSSRLKYANDVELFLIHLSYDALIITATETTRIRSKTVLENSNTNMNLVVHLETPRPVLSVELSAGGFNSGSFESKAVVFLREVITSEFYARNTKAIFEISSQAALHQYDKHIVNSLTFHVIPKEWIQIESVSVWKSIKNSAVPETSLGLLTNLKKDNHAGLSSRTQMTLGDRLWSVDLNVIRSNSTQNRSSVQITIQQPDMDRIDAYSSYLAHQTYNNLTFEAETSVSLPSKVLYQIKVDSKTHQSLDLSVGHMNIFIDTPFTDLITFNTNALKKQDNGLWIEVNSQTGSVAGFWKSLNSSINLLIREEKTVFVIGFFREKSLKAALNTTFLGNQLTNGRNISVVGEMAILSTEPASAYTLHLNGDFKGSLSPPQLMLNQATKVSVNKENCVESEGFLQIQIPRISGALSLKHSGKILQNHVYKLKGKISRRELDSRLTGSIDKIPIRGRIRYIDGQKLRIGGSYSNKSFASIGLETRFDSRVFRKQKMISNSPTKVTSTGFLNWKTIKTKFLNVIRWSGKETSSILRIRNLQGKPLELTVKREKHSMHLFSTASKLSWGRLNVSYEDDIKLVNIRDFDAKVNFKAPSDDLKDVRFHIGSSHQRDWDQNLFIDYSNLDESIYRGKFSIASEVIRNASLKIGANITDLVLNRTPYNNICSRNQISLAKEDLEMDSHVSKGQVDLLRVNINSKDRGLNLVGLLLCKDNKKCLRLKCSSSLSFKKMYSDHLELNIEVMNSLLDLPLSPLHQHEIVLIGRNMKNGAFIANTTLSRKLCSSGNCLNPTLVGIHGLSLKMVSPVIDLSYITLNKTIRMKAKQNQFTNPSGSRFYNEKNVSLLFWLDYERLPSNFYEWNTSYALIDNASVDHIITSSLNHRAMSRPIELRAKFVSLTKFKHQAQIVLDVFQEPTQAAEVQIEADASTPNRTVNAWIKKSDGSHISHLQAFMHASLITGGFGVKTSVFRKEGPSMLPTSIGVQCGVNLLQNEGQQKCMVLSNSTQANWSFSQVYANIPACEGIALQTNFYGEESSIMGQICPRPLLVKGNIDFGGKKDEMFLGQPTATSYGANIPGLINSNVTLHSPFLLHLTSNTVENIFHLISKAKAEFWNHLRFVIGKTKQTGIALSEDLAIFEKVHMDFLSQSSLVDELADIISNEWHNTVDEMEHDKLFIDIKRGARKSMDYLSSSFRPFWRTIKTQIQILPSWNDFTEKLYGLIYSYQSYLVQSTTHIYTLGMDLISAVKNSAKNLIHTSGIFVSEKLNFKEIQIWLRSHSEKLAFVPVLQLVKYIFSKVNGIAVRVVDRFYGIPKNEVTGVQIVVPIPLASYTLSDIATIFTKGKEENTRKTLFGQINYWKAKISEPSVSFSQVLSPPKAFASFFGDSFVTFGGDYGRISRNTSHVLLVVDSMGNSSFYMTADQSETGKFSLQMKIDYSFITFSPHLGVQIDGQLVSLPYLTNGIRVSRTLDEFEITYSANLQDVIQVICGVHRSVCLLQIDGWILSQSRGLLVDGSAAIDLDLDQGNIQTVPATVEKNCEKNDATWKEICGLYFKQLESPYVSCHDDANPDPFYLHCSQDCFAPQNSNLDTSESSYQKSGTFQKPYKPLHHPIEHLEYLPKSQKNYICDASMAYTLKCGKKDIFLSGIKQCDAPTVFPDQTDTGIAVDFILLTKRSTCPEFLQKELIDSLPSVIEDSMKATHISLLMGHIEYDDGRHGSHPTFYTSGKNLLFPPKKFKSPRTTTSSGGTLDEALDEAMKYPFRERSIRVIYIASCTSDDLNMVTKERVREMKKKRILLYSLVTENILMATEFVKLRPAIIGMDSKFLYKIRGPKVYLNDFWGFLNPSSNRGKLALQSGGGIFSLKVLEERGSIRLMKHFRKVMISSILYVAREQHSQIPLK